MSPAVSAPRRGQRAERCRLHAGVGIAEASPGDGRVSTVAGQRDPTPAPVGAAVGGHIRGNIVPHPSSMSDPDATADGDAAAIPSSQRRRPDRGRCVGATLPPAGVRGRRRIWPVFLAVLALIVIAGFIAARISVNYYVITPGTPPRSPSTSRCRRATTTH